MAFLPICDVASKCAADFERLILNWNPGVDADQPRSSSERHAASAKQDANDIPSQIKALGAGLISLNQRIAVWFNSKKMKMIRIAMMVLITSAATASGGGTLHATDRPLLIDIHRAAGLKCAQCHHEQPPTLAPAATTCLGCHGDQLTLANKTSGAFPNPHAPPHVAAGEIQNCNECHHVHRKSEVSCSACHREFEFDVK